MQHCETTFYYSINSSPLVLSALFLSALVLPAIIKFYLNTSKSYEGSAFWYIGVGLRLCLTTSAVYWTLDFLEVSPAYSYDFKTSKIVLARLLLGIGLVGANIAWLRSAPLCLRISMTNNQEKIKQAVAEGDMVTANKLAPVSVVIIGFGNSYGSLYLLFILNSFVLFVITAKPIAGIAMSGFLLQIFSLLELSEIHSLYASSPLLLTTILSLLSHELIFLLLAIKQL